MENQHRQIKGYRELSQAEIDLMNEGKALAEQVGAFVEKLESATYPSPDGQTQNAPDGTWLFIGKTDLQKGFMALIRSIAKPETF